MIHYKNNRFHTGGLSYALPQNIFLLTKETEYSDPNGFVYTDEERKILVIIDTEAFGGTPENYFKTDDFTEDTHIIGEITTDKIDGLDLAYAYCENKRCEYLEAVIQLPCPTSKATLLTIGVEVAKDKLSIKEAAKNYIVTELIESIRKD